MTVSNTTSVVQFANISTGTAVVAGIASKGVLSEFYVEYGQYHHVAVQGTDYLISIAGDLNSVTITPQASLLTKIATDGPNVIWVKRILPFTTQFDYNHAFVRQAIVDEFDRVWMADQQIDYRLDVLEAVPSQPGLAPIAPLNPAADTMAYYTSTTAAAITSLTPFSRTLLDDTTAAAWRATMGIVIGGDIQAQDPTLQAMAGVVTGADKYIYFTGVDVAVAGTITTFGRSLIDDADATAARATIGLAIGTNVQAYDATLTSIAGLGTASDKM